MLRNNNLVGSAKFLQRIILQMRKYPQKYRFVFYMQPDIDPTIFGISKPLQYTIVRVPKLQNRIVRILFEQTLFYLYLKSCDIMYSHCTYLPLFGKWKKVCTLHDMLPFANKKKHSWLRRNLIVVITHLISRQMNHIITVSQNSKNDIVKYLHVPENKVSIIYNFIDPKEEVVKNCPVTGNCIYASNKSRIEIKMPFLCTVSSLQPGKNIAGLIKAFSLFHTRFPKYHLYIVGGKGWGYQEIFGKVDSLRLKEYVHFTGYIEDGELDKLYTSCVGVVYVSFFEGFGIPPLEGFYHNKSCLVSNTTSLPEIVGQAGYYADPYDVKSIATGLEKLVTDSCCTQYIPEQIAKFNPEKQVLKFINIMDSLTK